MLFLSSKIGNTGVIGIASMLLQSTPPAIQPSYELISLISPGANSFEVRLRLVLALLEHDQVLQAERIFENFNATEFIRNVQKVSGIKSLFNLLPYVQQDEKTVETLDFVASKNIFDEYGLIELKLRTANLFILIGKSDVAELILESISPAEITNQNHLSDLILYYIYLSKFESAMNIFDFAEQKGMIHHPNFSVFMAINQFCLNDIEKAKTTIDKDIAFNSSAVLNMFWKAKLLNYTGQHDQAAFWIETLLNGSSDIPLVHKCFYLVEKGNTLRSLGRIDESIKCYQKAVENDIGALHWLWIAYFEYAMTLVYLRELNGALSIAIKGRNCKSYKYNSKYNPCSILSDFLSLRLNQLPETSVNGWADCACLWPYPFFPYKIWMLVLTGIALEEKRFYDEARNVYNKIHKTYVCASEAKGNGLFLMREKDIIFRNRNRMDILQSKFWPKDFNWKIFRQLSDLEG